MVANTGEVLPGSVERPLHVKRGGRKKPAVGRGAEGKSVSSAERVEDSWPLQMRGGLRAVISDGVGRAINRPLTSSDARSVEKREKGPQKNEKLKGPKLSLPSSSRPSVGDCQTNRAKTSGGTETVARELRQILTVGSDAAGQRSFLYEQGRAGGRNATDVHEPKIPVKKFPGKDLKDQRSQGERHYTGAGEGGTKREGPGGT